MIKVKDWLISVILWWKVRKTMKGNYVFNPFRKWPKNLQCYCGSGVKFKKCCAFKIYDVIPKPMQEKVQFLYNEAMKLYGKK